MFAILTDYDVVDPDTFNELLITEDINEKNSNGLTPLMIAAIHSKYHAMKRLLMVNANVNEIDFYGNTVLQKLLYSYDCCEMELIELLLCIPNIKLDNIHDKITCANHLQLILDYESSPITSRNRLRRKHGFPDIASQYFALVVMVCDDYFTSTDNKFMNIVTRLPIELQFIICNYANGSCKKNIHSRDIEMSLIKFFS